MPYINVQITKEATREAKSKIVEETTNTIVNTFNNKSEHIYIVIQEW